MEDEAVRFFIPGVPYEYVVSFFCAFHVFFSFLSVSYLQFVRARGQQRGSETRTRIKRIKSMVVSSSVSGARGTSSVSKLSSSTTSRLMPTRRQQVNHRQRFGDLQVTHAITKEKKTEILTKLTSELETSTAIVGFTFKGVSVQDLEKVRGEIPDDASLMIAKNTLMAKAASEVEGWAELSQTCKGSNAFLFLREDLKTGFKAVRDLQKTYKKADYPVEFNGGCCDGQFLNVDDIKKLEKLPSKLELIAKIASCINQVPTRLAVSVKQVPTKLATGVKKISEGEVEPAEQAASA